MFKESSPPRFEDFSNINFNIRFHFCLTPVEETEIDSYIGILKPRAANGLDGISSKVIKYFKDKLSSLLATLINKCLVTGDFPSCLKIAKIVPIHKSGSELLPEN